MTKSRRKKTRKPADVEMQLLAQLLARAEAISIPIDDPASRPI
jgi:hypothetical protein